MCQSSLLQQLVEAVRQHAGLDDEQIIEAGRYGADAGWPGFIYNSDAAAFFDEHADLIWLVLSQLADELGEPNPVALIAGFNCCDIAVSYEGFKVLLAWFALEESGRYLGDV